MLRLSIIGCGNVAKTLAHLWHQAGVVEIVDVINRSQDSANTSVNFIGAGRALASIKALQQADVFVIACGDDAIEACCDELVTQKVIEKDTIVFHFSGAKSSGVLNKAKVQGAFCASLHPVKSFANPKSAIKTFSNTYCGLEGDEEAVKKLTMMIESIGAHSFDVDGDKKLMYHSASVFACNYLVALQELSLQALEYSGLKRELAMNILEPIVKETANNIFTMGTEKSVTGPIARGDHQLVDEQYEATKNWNEDASEIYRLLGKLTVSLSDQKGVSEKTDLKEIKRLFKK